MRAILTIDEHTKVELVVVADLSKFGLVVNQVS